MTILILKSGAMAPNQRNVERNVRVACCTLRSIIFERNVAQLVIKTFDCSASSRSVSLQPSFALSPVADPLLRKEKVVTPRGWPRPSQSVALEVWP